MTDLDQICCLTHLCITRDSDILQVFGTARVPLLFFNWFPHYRWTKELFQKPTSKLKVSWEKKKSLEHLLAFSNLIMWIEWKMAMREKIRVQKHLCISLLISKYCEKALIRNHRKAANKNRCDFSIFLNCKIQWWKTKIIN